MSEIKIAKNYFLFDGNKYFRDNASAVHIGAYGKKKGSSITGDGRLEPEGRMKRSTFTSKVRRLRKLDIDWQKDVAADVDLEGVFKYCGLDFKGAQGVTFEKAKTMQLVLELFTIDAEPLEKILNTSATAALDYLRREGNEGRVATTVGIATTQELSEHLETASHVSASVAAGSDEVELVVSASNGSTSTVSFDKGTFCYRLHRVTDWSKGKEQITKLASDYYGTK